jgi:glycerol-3-phosphate O-acyltransferase / dihydroxyacetone phosphate acyltransferase
MNPIMLLVYRFLQGLAGLTNLIYFRKIVFLNRQYLAAKGPLIVLCNHPNTVVDPLLSIMFTREPVFLLANYGLFKNPIAGAILRTLFCIPVKRTKDVAEGEERNNDDAFRASETHLKAGRSLFIAPEGTSYTERHIREFKTGLARIIFEAESQSDFKLNVRILPIGLTYFDPLKFNSDVVVEVGEPFSALDWREKYAEDKRQTVENFTQYVENQFHTLSIHCADVEEDYFLQKLEAILQAENPLNTEGVYFRSKKILATLQNWKKTDATDFSIFEQSVNAYLARLKDLDLKDVNVQTFPAAITLMKYLIGLPFFILGLIPNSLPAYVSNGLVKWLKLDSAYDTTVRMLAGLVLFPLFWWGQTEIFFTYFFPKTTNLGAFYTLLLAAAYLASGLLAWRIYKGGVAFFNFKKFKRADADGSLTALRQPLVKTATELAQSANSIAQPLSTV